MNKRAIIIGGGFAGLAASVELISSGYHVTLIEQRKHLGGRAWSFKDRNIDIELDNGQHILMGCYENTFRFLNTIGTIDKLYTQKNLHVDFMDTYGHAYSLDCPPLPAPIHTALGILRFKALGFPDRIKMLKVAGDVFFNKTINSSRDCTVSEWLSRLNQGRESRDSFWNILTLAVMNEGPDMASAMLFRTVLNKAFFASHKWSRIVIPAVPLTRLYADNAEDYIRHRGGAIEKGCIVSEIMTGGGAVSAIRLQDGRTLKGDYYISAIPDHALKRLLEDTVIEREYPYFAGIIELKPSPIISIHLLFNKAITEYPFAALINSPVQWVFNKEKIYRDNAYRGLVSLTISGAHQYIGWDKDKLLDMSLTELKKIFPEACSAKLLYSKAIKERSATFSPRPGIHRYRPTQKTPIKNLFLAGDWTDTGLPATIEGAVISGYRCAALIKG